MGDRSECPAASRALDLLSDQIIGQLQPAVASRTIDDRGHAENPWGAAPFCDNAELSECILDFLIGKNNGGPDSKWQAEDATTIEAIDHRHDTAGQAEA